MRVDPKSIGERSEAMIIASLLRRGRTVLLPFGDNQRYDLVIDDGGVFTRVQCKTGRVTNGAIEFQTSSATYKGQKRHYHGEADVFAIYSPVLDKAWMIPVSETARSTCRLRLEPSKNGQQSGVKYASDYELT
jgi:hypothetical protein